MLDSSLTARWFGLRWLLALTVAIGLLASWLAAPVAQAEDIALLVDEVESQFPDRLIFRYEAAPDQPFARVRLNYTVGRDGSSSYVYLPAGESDGRAGEFSLWTFASGYIPPKAAITYWYGFEDAAGRVLESPRRTVVYDDPAYDWQVLEQGGIAVHYHALDAARAELILQVALDTVATARSSFGVDITNPIAVVVYNDLDEIDRALPGQDFDHSDGLITLGQAHPDRDVVLVLDYEANDALLVETTRHEVQHVITSQATKNPYSALPVWLNEGLSVYVEGSEPLGYLAQFGWMQRNGNVPHLRDLARRPADPDQQLLLYGQGYLVVKHLHDRYGAASIRRLLDAYKRGQDTAQAFQSVFGKTLDQVDTEWRATVGLPPVPDRSNALPTGTPVAVPTVVPLGS